MPLNCHKVGGAGDEQAGPRGVQHRAGHRGGAGGAVAEARGGGADQPQGAQVARRVPVIDDEELQNSNLNVFRQFSLGRRRTWCLFYCVIRDGCEYDLVNL